MLSRAQHAHPDAMPPSMPPTPPPDFTGTPRYRVLRRLGAGGMGVVYLAHDLERGMDVALKVLLRIDADGIYRLKAEFRSLADVSHPNLVGLYDLVSYADQWFFTMEVVEGVDFLEYVREPEPRPLDPVRAQMLADPTVAHAGPIQKEPEPPLEPKDSGLVPLVPVQSAVTSLDTIAFDEVPELNEPPQDTLVETSDHKLTSPQTQMDTVGFETPPPPPPQRQRHAFSDVTMEFEPARHMDSGHTDRGLRLPRVRDPSVMAFARTAKPANIPRLRAAMRQLADAVHAIHLAGKLHRDIKPSNAMVETSGEDLRVVMLDFGLVQDDASLGHLKSKRDSQHDRAISGTPAYMAPEQAMGGEVTAASDWYAVGVMLYQSLTGELPFQGSWYQLLEAKLHGKPLPPDALAPDVPADLADLTLKLLAPKAQDRPRSQEILRVLGLEARQDSGMQTVEDVEPPMLGREQELTTLRETWQSLRHLKQPHLVHVLGPAGIGKTAIVETWLAEVREQGRQAPLVLTGRCHEREAVPYKAFDAVIDALTRHLLRLDFDGLEKVLPQDVAALGQIFPVLRRVPAIDRAPLKQAELEDRRGLLRRATIALKRLLGKLAAQQPLIVAIEDMQWGDADSVELLTTLLEPPEGLPALVLLSWRDEDLARNPVLQAVRRVGNAAQSLVKTVDVRVEPLAREHAVELALAMMTQKGEEARRRAEIMAKEAAGSPLFIVELVRFRQTGLANTTAHTDPEVTLDQVLRARIDHLPPPARSLLDVVAVAGKPIAQRRAFTASALGKEEPAAIARLRNGRYVRTAGVGDEALIETFHNRIREAAIALLPAEVLQAKHAALLDVLTVLDAEGKLDVDTLAYHALGAGRHEEALQYSLEAGRKAHAVFANHDALRHFDNVLRLLAEDPGPHAQKLKLLVQEEAAEAARQAGRYERAKQLLTARLSVEQDHERQAELHVGLGRVAQERGDTDEAIMQLETALHMFGKTAPRNLLELGWQATGQFLQHLARTFLPTFSPKPSTDPHDQKRADIMFALIRIYYFIDVAKVVWAGVTTINMAPKFRRGGDVSMAYSFYGVLLFGMGRLKLAEHWCMEAVTLARMNGDAVAEATGVMRLGTTLMFANNLDRGEKLLGEAIVQFKAIGEMWELQTGLMLHATTLFMLGDFRRAAVIYDEMGQYGEQLNMVMHRGWHEAWAPFCRYLTGELDAESTQKALDRAIEFSARAKDVANTVASLQHMANLAVREGQVERAAGLAVRTHECVSRYLVLVPFLQRARIDAAEAAIFALENNAVSVKKSRLRGIVKDGYRAVAVMGLMYPFLKPLAMRLRARYVAHVRGEKAAAGLFRKAITAAEMTPNRWEIAQVWYDAAKCLPGQRAECRDQARRIFTELGAVAELRRLEREMPG